eukprot:3015696-Rhodomonas_salina.1
MEDADSTAHLRGGSTHVLSLTTKYIGSSRLNLAHSVALTCNGVALNGVALTRNGVDLKLFEEVMQLSRYVNMKTKKDEIPL